MKEKPSASTAKQHYDLMYEEVQKANAAYDAVIQEESAYREKRTAAREVLLEAKERLRQAGIAVNREATANLAGRPPAVEKNISREPKETAPKKTATKETGKKAKSVEAA
jgi:hypothetical protein